MIAKFIFSNGKKYSVAVPNRRVISKLQKLVLQVEKGIKIKRIEILEDADFWEIAGRRVKIPE